MLPAGTVSIIRNSFKSWRHNHSSFNLFLFLNGEDSIWKTGYHKKENCESFPKLPGNPGFDELVPNNYCWKMKKADSMFKLGRSSIIKNSPNVKKHIIYGRFRVRQ